MIVVELDPIEVLNVLLLDLTGSSQQLCGQSIVFSESWASTSSALDINLLAVGHLQFGGLRSTKTTLQFLSSPTQSQSCG